MWRTPRDLSKIKKQRQNSPLIVFAIRCFMFRCIIFALYSDTAASRGKTMTAIAAGAWTYSLRAPIHAENETG